MTLRLADSVCLTNNVCFSKALVGCATANAPVGVLGLSMASAFPWKQVALCFGRQGRDAVASFVAFGDEPETAWQSLEDTGVRYRGTIGFLSSSFANLSVALSTTQPFSFVPAPVFARMRKEVLDIVPLGHGLHLDFADAASLACFRVQDGFDALLEGAVPDLTWLARARGRSLLYSTSDGSRCIGVFASGSDGVVLGRNALAGALVRIDHVNKRLDVGACGAGDAVVPFSSIGPLATFAIGVGLGILAVAALRWAYLRCRAEQSKAARRRSRMERRLKRRVSFEDVVKAGAVSEENKGLVAEGRKADALKAAGIEGGSDDDDDDAKGERDGELRVANV